VSVIDSLNTQVNEFVKKKKQLEAAKAEALDKIGEANE